MDLIKITPSSIIAAFWVCAVLPAIHHSWKAALKTTRTAACPTDTVAFRNKSALQKQSS